MSSKYLTLINHQLLSNRLVLVTGANRGIGLSTAKIFAALGADVILACRHPQLAHNSIHEIIRPFIRSSGLPPVPDQRLQPMTLDLASLKSTGEFLERYRQLFPLRSHPDIIVNNAGCLLNHRRETEDKIEETMQVNHLAPAWLTLKFCREAIKSQRDLRVINVSASVHRTVKSIDDFQSKEEPFNGWQTYCRSKLAQILFSNHLQTLVNTDLSSVLGGTSSKISTVCLDPGWLKTNLVRPEHGWSEEDIKKKTGGASLDVDSGTLTILHAALLDPPQKGGFMARERVMKESAEAKDPQMQAVLWQKTMECIPEW